MENVHFLIDKITPLYNLYKRDKNVLSATQALQLMWDIGELLYEYLEKHNIKPHTLYRQIYGKSEGSQNIEQKSYIPREFQGRCYRIRRIFPDKEKILEELPKLKKFSCFREAMPFFDNPKYKLSATERAQLLALLNSSLPAKDILRQIKVLQNKRIGIKNPRTQRLHELESEKESFIEFYNFIYNIIKLGSYDQISNETDNVNRQLLLMLSKNTSALAGDGYKFFDFDIPEDAPSIWRNYANMVKELSKQISPQVRRRFRRLIPPIRLVRLADMLHALTSEESYKSFRSLTK
jgi:hypothetical protein